MRDLKPKKRAAKPKSNRRKKQPRDWRALSRQMLHYALVGSSAGLILAGSILLARVMLDSGYFNIARVDVSRGNRVSPEEVVELSNIHLGDNLLRLDLEQIGAKIAENPWVATVDVRRVFPDSVQIEVRERIPVAILNLGYLYCVDERGEIFKLLEPQDPIDLPVITGVERQVLLDDPGSMRERLAMAVQVLRELEGRITFSLKEVSELHLASNGELILFTYLGGVPIELGRRGFRAKLDRLEKIYQDLRPQLPMLSYIDLTVNDRVIVSRVADKTTSRG